MRFATCRLIVCSTLVLIAFAATSVQAFEDDALWLDDNIFSMEINDESSSKSSERSVISKMIERGKLLWKSIPKTGLKLAGHVLNYVPTPETIFNVGKQALVGLPQELIAYAVNSVCSAAIHINAIKPQITPSVHLMNFQFFAYNGEKFSIPLLQPHKLWNNSYFKPDWNTTLVVTGWNSNVNSTNEAMETLLRAYKSRKSNFIVFDTAHFIDSLYTWSAFNTEGVGKIVGGAVAELTKVIDVDKVHLIGHSLGAHVCGYAGRTYYDLTGKMLPRISGLDPARPCFNEGERLSGLQRGDAKFVDIIHSNAGILGIKEPKGDVDFFPNGRYSLQPGCWTIICAHSRSYEYFAETVYEKNGNNFMAAQCNSMSSFRNGKCTSKRVPMGIDTPPTARGNFYLETNKESPFGRKHVFANIRQLTERILSAH